MKNNTILFLLCGITSTSIGIAFGVAKERKATAKQIEKAYYYGYSDGMLCEECSWYLHNKMHQEPSH